MLGLCRPAEADLRAEGRTALAVGAQVGLGWPAQAEHYFDSQGSRVA